MEDNCGNYLNSAKKLFEYYKNLAESAIAQLKPEDLHRKFDNESNSIAVIMRHMAGNSLSRWTDFLNSDGEKPWRNRDNEFEDDSTGENELMIYWKSGWKALFTALDQAEEEDLSRLVYIRNEGHTISEAINRQLAHLSYHTGQIVFIAKMIAGSNWKSLTIPKGKSGTFNADKFSKDRVSKFFTDSQ